MLKTLYNGRILQTLLLCFTVLLCSSNFSFVYADDPTGIVTIFCNVINQITGGIGKVIAILILISMAIGLFLGKITWGLAIAVMVGMGLLFGASTLVDTIAAGTGNSDSNKNICKNQNPAPAGG